MSVEHRVRAWAQLHRSPKEATLFLQNIPPSSTKSQFMAWIDSLGFEGWYDFLYLPRMFATHECQGYAFINLTDNEVAQRFKLTMHGTAMAPDLKLKVQISKIQGLEENLARWATARCRRVRNSEVLPFVRAFGEMGMDFRPSDFVAETDGPPLRPPRQEQVPIPKSLRWTSEASCSTTDESTPLGLKPPYKAEASAPEIADKPRVSAALMWLDQGEPSPQYQ
jgi:hypothetical protein